MVSLLRSITGGLQTSSSEQVGNRRALKQSLVDSGRLSVDGGAVGGSRLVLASRASLEGALRSERGCLLGVVPRSLWPLRVPRIPGMALPFWS